jgi:hypothetical protein
VIIISPGNVHLGAGTNAALLEELQQPAVALVNATHQVIAAGLGMG